MSHIHFEQYFGDREDYSHDIPETGMHHHETFPYGKSLDGPGRDSRDSLY